MRSSPRRIRCSTKSTVIWVPVLVIILLGLLAAMGVFVLRRKPELLRLLLDKTISVKKFPDHLYLLSRDENREFSVEYSQLSTVGADLSQREAALPDNKSKNRFIDILPYDCSRVKLSTRGQNSDYINANFIPGYGGKKMEYIAAQGPLSSTVSDFWRMIWEQNSERIVMVTNCVENGKAKCDQYWPQGPSPCRHGDLLISMTSERKDSNWTVRVLIVKNEAKSEERRVKHFHFTTWPDHGVPNGTEELIQFCGHIRQHIDSSQSSGPTVVHCSAGVGRTGTLIALDVLLQQVEREQAVDIAGIVHRMRRHRPRMVQTESQYIFLHQCIKDLLTQKKPEEPLYGNTAAINTDVIYENTAAMTVDGLGPQE
ncbi:receptor-type tyrosine-protein phosphatase H-like [Sardina pilchardus]|uniref:receptor-type tyrosine-protein phosphatase H-like n=1 Tax=Sardina pilchardus TaxID=27697 RepID=UPI002E12ACAD